MHVVFFLLLFMFYVMDSKISKVVKYQLPFSEPVMSDEITWPTMKTSVELGARFLIKKPLGAETINDLWQHLDIRNRREKIEDLFRGWRYCIYGTLLLVL
jgi:hypothetical protein